MSFNRNSRQEKAIMAIAFWLFAVLVSLPLWDFMLVSVYCFWPLSELLTIYRCLPAVPGMAMLLFIFREEDGTEAMILHYLPAVAIASVLAVWVLSRWWRPRKRS